MSGSGSENSLGLFSFYLDFWRDMECLKFEETVTIFSFSPLVQIFFFLNSPMQISHIQILWILPSQVGDDVSPANRSHGWLNLRLISNYQPRLCLPVVQIFSIGIELLIGTFLETDRAHIVIKAVIDVGFVWVL